MFIKVTAVGINTVTVITKSDNAVQAVGYFFMQLQVVHLLFGKLGRVKFLLVIYTTPANLTLTAGKVQIMQVLTVTR